MPTHPHPLFENIFWNDLTGSHAALAVGSSGARRYAPGYSPIAAFADNERPDLDALALHCEVGEKLYCSGWRGDTPSGWNLLFEAPMIRMVWDTAMPDADASFEAVPLDPRLHTPQVVELAALTKPGPFGPRTIELGDFFGCFDADQRLIAMAGERTHAGLLREISGVCTHPEFQGRGLARRLMLLLIRRERERGELPFLHVVASNAVARGLYRRMGFREDAETNVRVISRR